MPCETPLMNLPVPSFDFEILRRIRAEWFGNMRGDVLAGLVVALALIPEAISFSIIAGVDPQVGLFAQLLDCGADRVSRAGVRA